MSKNTLPTKSYTIGEVSQIVDLKEHVLRFWEKEFEELSPNKSQKGRRCYTAKDIQTIQKIKALLYKEQYTIPGAKKQLKQLKNTTPHPQLTLKKNYQYIITELKEIQKLLNH